MSGRYPSSPRFSVPERSRIARISFFRALTITARGRRRTISSFLMRGVNGYIARMVCESSCRNSLADEGA